jgi:hypothetical protein
VLLALESLQGLLEGGRIVGVDRSDDPQVGDRPQRRVVLEHHFLVDVDVARRQWRQ